MKAGEYMQEFKDKYKQQEGKDNFGEISDEIVRDIVKALV